MPDARPVLLLTRPEPASEAFWNALPHALRDRLRLIVSPLLHIDPVGPAPELTGIDALVVTSAQVFAALTALGFDLPPGLRCWCVGGATAAAATQAGLDARSADGDADALVALVSSQALGQRLLHLRGAHSRGDVAARLTVAGAPTAERIVYDQRALPLSDAARAALHGAAPVIVPLFSPRSAALFAAGQPGPAPLYLACMSAAVAQKTAGLTARARRIAASPDAASMATLVGHLSDEASFLERPDRGL